jgi:hypothetical protein
MGNVITLLNAAAASREYAERSPERHHPGIPEPRHSSVINLRGDQEGLFKLVTLDRILNRITGVTSGCWLRVVINDIPISDICQINQQNIQLQCYK